MLLSWRSCGVERHITAMVSISRSLARTHVSSSMHEIHPRGSSPQLAKGWHHDSVHMSSSFLFRHQVFFESYHIYDLPFTNTGPRRQSSAHHQLQTGSLTDFQVLLTLSVVVLRALLGLSSFISYFGIIKSKLFKVFFDSQFYRILTSPPQHKNVSSTPRSKHSVSSYIQNVNYLPYHSPQAPHLQYLTTPQCANKPTASTSPSNTASPLPAPPPPLERSVSSPSPSTCNSTLPSAYTYCASHTVHRAKTRKLNFFTKLFHNHYKPCENFCLQTRVVEGGLSDLHVAAKGRGEG